jgi:hypothetical protein
MQKRLITILLSLIVALTSCNRGKRSATPARELSAAEYEVLTAWIDAKLIGNERSGTKNAKQFVIFDTTNSGDNHLLPDGNGQAVPWEKTAESLRKADPALQQGTLDEFRKVNARQGFLRRSFHPSIDYVIVNSAQLESIFCKTCRSWLAYYKQFPGSQGLLTFSRVGFNADGTQAFFYFSNSCDGLCGTGDYVVMEKHDGRWIIQREVNMWVS